MISDTDRAYLAGIIDGEGCIGIYLTKNPNGRRTYRLTVNVTSTSIRWLLDLKDRWGVGSAYTRRRSNPKHKDTASWQIRGMEAQSLLKEILPYLGIKRDRALLALSFKVGTAAKVVPLKMVDEQKRVAEQLSILNRRGVTPTSATIH